MKAIVVEHIYKTYKRAGGMRRTEVLHDVHLEVKAGELLILLGPSGCGKSTLLRIMAGLDHPTQGKVSYDPSIDRKKIGFVFQNFGLMPWLTVRENVELNLIGQGVKKEVRKKEVDKILLRFGLHHFAEHKPHDLSGGMRQRVGIARAFVTKPDIIFLDEPFSELDFFTAESLRAELLALWRETGATVVMVSHYIDEAVALADRIAVFSDRPGTVLHTIENPLSRPRMKRSAEFFALEDAVLAKFANKPL
jgi:NitT/TauT family transport system ATP-binding protein